MNKSKRVTNLSSSKEVFQKTINFENNSYIENNNFQLNLMNINVNEVKI